MSTPAAPVTGGRDLVGIYVATVAGLAVSLFVLTVALDLADANPAARWVRIAIFAVFLFLGETRRWFSFADGGGVTPGWAFAFSIVLLGSPTAAAIAIAGCTLYVDLRDRREKRKVLFNVSQVVVSLTAGALLLRPFGVTGPITADGQLATREAIGVMAAGVAVFVLNGLLTCGVLAMYHRIAFRSMLSRDFVLSVSPDGALLALSPILVVAITYSLLLIPMLGVAVLLVYRSTQQSIERAHEANHDPLTRLLNRRAFSNHVEGFLESHLDNCARGAVVLFDLDGFKEVNDRLGHEIGDRLLQGVAEQIEQASPRGSVVARLGGDEFALFVPDVGTDDETKAMAAHLRLRITRPIDIDGFPLQVGASFGVAFAPEHGRTPADLLSTADIAMYRAKRYRSGVEIYRSTGSRRELGRISLLSELSSAIERNELSVQYQPQVNLLTERSNVVEALIRWNHPVLGYVPPADFITLAEHTELIGPLTEFVLGRAIRDALSLPAVDLRVAVNVSARNLQDRRFPAQVLEQIESAGLAPERLELEITESAIASEPERAMHAIGLLREAGITIAIDDFGAGYSSFAMLQDLHIDRLKIDKRFVGGIAKSQRQQHIVGGIVSLAKGLEIDTVAEGVETDRDRLMLRTLGCDNAQGYLLGRPAPIADLFLWLDRRDHFATEHDELGPFIDHDETDLELTSRGESSHSAEPESSDQTSQVSA